MPTQGLGSALRPWSLRWLRSAGPHDPSLRRAIRPRSLASEAPKPFDSHIPLPNDGSCGSPPAANEMLTTTPFEALDIAPNIRHSILYQMGLRFAAHIQARSLPTLLAGKDAVLQARAGHGKTLAFLLPIADHLHRHPSRDPHRISAVLLAPSTELVDQIAAQARVLMAFCDAKVLAMHSGTDSRQEQVALRRAHRTPGRPTNRIDLVIATPQRFFWHFLDTRSGMRERVAQLQALVIDEADMLLDPEAGATFRHVLRLLPPKAARQTILASATFPLSEMQHTLTKVLRGSYEVISTVGDSEVHRHVPQHVHVVPLAHQPAALAKILLQETALPNHKVMVFGVTAKVSDYLEILLRSSSLASRTTILHTSSRQKMALREKASALFHGRDGVVLCCSDLAARGMDFPDVTAVIQVGSPASRYTYIHRLGRTARAGKTGGIGHLLLAPFERPFLEAIRDLTWTSHEWAPGETDFRPRVPEEEWPRARLAWEDWLLFQAQRKDLALKPRQLAICAASYALSLGLPGPPPLRKHVLEKYNLLGIPELPVSSDS